MDGFQIEFGIVTFPEIKMETKHLPGRPSMGFFSRAPSPNSHTTTNKAHFSGLIGRTPGEFGPKILQKSNITIVGGKRGSGSKTSLKPPNLITMRKLSTHFNNFL